MILFRQILFRQGSRTHTISLFVHTPFTHFLHMRRSCCIPGPSTGDVQFEPKALQGGSMQRVAGLPQKQDALIYFHSHIRCRNSGRQWSRGRAGASGHRLSLNLRTGPFAACRMYGHTSILTIFIPATRLLSENGQRRPICHFHFGLRSVSHIPKAPSPRHEPICLSHP